VVTRDVAPAAGLAATGRSASRPRSAPGWTRMWTRMSRRTTELHRRIVLEERW